VVVASVSFTDVATWVGGAAGLVALLQFAGALRRLRDSLPQWLRERLPLRRRERGVRFFTASRTLELIVAMVGAAIVLVGVLSPNVLIVAVLVGVLLVAGVVRQVIEWRRESGNRQVLSQREQGSPEPLPQEVPMPPSLSPTAGGGLGEAGTDEPTGDFEDDEYETPRAECHVMDELVELRLTRVPFLVRNITCEVVPPRGKRFKAKADLHPTTDFFGAMHAEHIAVAQYPDDFPNAPPLVPGRYTVRWLERHPMWFTVLGAQATHTSFTY
jgi:hypothetical protein